MPKRSNEFQRFVHDLERLRAPSGSTVTESKMVIDRATGRDREVDVVIEAKQGLRSLRIGVECRDHRRKADISWIDELIGRKTLELDRLVAVARAGFTQGAAEKAKANGIETIDMKARKLVAWISAFAYQYHIRSPHPPNRDSRYPGRPHQQPVSLGREPFSPRPQSGLLQAKKRLRWLDVPLRQRGLPVKASLAMRQLHILSVVTALLAMGGCEVSSLPPGVAIDAQVYDVGIPDQRMPQVQDGSQTLDLLPERAVADMTDASQPFDLTEGCSAKEVNCSGDGGARCSDPLSDAMNCGTCGQG